MRCDVNISVRKHGSTVYGTRCEVKNVNSMRFARRAVAYEVRRQVAILERGGSVQQQTLNFDPQTGVTTPIRNKENAHDYRYFPDPDLPPIVLKTGWLADIRQTMPILPAECREHLVTRLQVSPKDALTLSEDKKTALYALQFLSACPEHLRKAGGHFLIQKVLPYLETERCSVVEYPLSATQIVDLIELIDKQKVNSTTAYQTLLPALLSDPAQQPTALAEKLNLFQNADVDWLSNLVRHVVAQNPDKVAAYRKGKKGLSAFFVGESMKAAKGKADPKQLNSLVLDCLNNATV
jgi:aspartyl-tRNA(Asn)/glutamyl-tRNA(Gln) amidotransferase subunit B